jgi:hypothetical protein
MVCNLALGHQMAIEFRSLLIPDMLEGATVRGDINVRPG